MGVDGAVLDTARKTGDPVADVAIGQIFTERAAAGLASDPGANFRRMLDEHPSVATAPPRTPSEQAWFDEVVELPPWADLERCESGRQFFNDWALEIGLGLFLCALPAAYAAEPGVPVLAMTGRLEDHAQERILETAQLVLDIGDRDSLLPSGNAYRTIRHVRLMHAAVRHLITTSDRIGRPGAPGPTGLVWEEHWGVPINQEHLAGTMVSFSYAMLEALDAMGLEHDQDAADDYLHLWAVAGHLIGVQDRLIPHDRESWRHLSDLIKERNYAPSAYGSALTRALLDVVRGYLPRPVRGLAPTTMRSMIGDEVADMLDVPKADWTRWLMLGIRGALQQEILDADHTALGRLLTRRMSMLVLRGFVEAQRPGRPAFAIPVSLAVGDAPLTRVARRGRGR